MSGLFDYATSQTQPTSDIRHPLNPRHQLFIQLTLGYVDLELENNIKKQASRFM